MSKSTLEDTLNSPSHFWRTIFEQKNLAKRIREIAETTDQNGSGTLFVLKDYGPIRVKADRATKIGDGFMGDTFIACATVGKNGTIFTAFVKIIPENPFLRLSAVSQRLYEREVGNYQFLHPTLRALRAECGVSDEEIPLNVPALYYTNFREVSENENGSDESIVLVMEDLKTQGFFMADKTAGCTYEQAKATLITLANYHALSIKFLRQQKLLSGDYEVPESLKFMETKTLFDEKGPMMVQGGLPLYVEVIRRMGQTEAADWLSKQTDHIAEYMALEDMQKCGPLSCILHADCWNNNMMYRTKEDGTTEMRLIDWQITRLGHAVTDCLHFFVSSTSPDLRQKYFDELMSHYFAVLNEALKKLGINLNEEKYTEKDFQREVRHRLRWGLCMGLLILPAILDQTMVQRMDNYDSEDVARLATGELNADNMFQEMGKKSENVFTVEHVLNNKVLSDRLARLVVEVKTALEE